MKLVSFANKINRKYNLLKISKISLDIDKSKINSKAVEVCKQLQDAGFEAYLVGGCVRDLLMGESPKDWDITTNAKPEETKKVFPKTYDTGLQHGTITVSMGPSTQDHFEVTTYRVEGEYTDGRRPDYVAFTGNIEDDLSRRDLSINAIAYDPVNDKIIDPHGGVEDLNNKIIRAVGDPNKRFAEDGLRTMRVARFAARFGFSVDPATQSAISGNLDVLKKVSKERVRDELTKTLITSKPSAGLKILSQTGALTVASPLLNDSKTSSNFSAIDACSKNMLVRMALLLNHLSVSDVEKILKDLSEHILAVPGTKGFHAFRARRVGDRFEVDFHLQVEETATVAKGHAIAGQVKSDILRLHPEVVSVLVHVPTAWPAAPVSAGIRREAVPPGLSRPRRR